MAVLLLRVRRARILAAANPRKEKTGRVPLPYVPVVRGENGDNEMIIRAQKKYWASFKYVTGKNVVYVNTNCIKWAEYDQKMDMTTILMKNEKEPIYCEGDVLKEAENHGI